MIVFINYLALFAVQYLSKLPCYKFSLKHITTGDILVKAYEDNLITEDQGNIIWSEMLSKRRRIGANSFTEFLKIKKSYNN